MSKIIKIIGFMALLVAFAGIAAGAEKSTGTAILNNEFLELCRYGTAREVSNAIASGADVNARDAANNNMTALMCAAYIAQNPATVNILVRRGADVNAKAQHDWTALMLAAMRNSNSEIINMLIKAGANINAKDSDGHTVLTYAAGFNKNSKAVDIAVALLKAGANINVKDNQGKTVYDYVDNPEILYKIGKMYMNGDGVKRDNSMGVRWIRKAAARGHKAANMELASSGAMSAQDFFELCRSGTVQDVSYAVRAGADVMAKNAEGESALIIASKYNTKNPDVVTALIKAGADVSVRDGDNKAAIDYIDNPELLYKVGMLFANGGNSGNIVKSSFPEEDQWEAVNWLRKAAHLGHKPSRNELARRRIYN